MRDHFAPVGTSASFDSMSLFIFLTVLQALIAAALVGVILVQRSEGGGLGVGGSPSGLMSARGAANFLTRATTILATLFVALSIVLAAVAVGATSGRSIDTSLKRTEPAPGAPAGDPLNADPLGGAAGGAPAPAPAPAPAQAQAPAPAPANDPLGGAAR
ncbi:preprotein translocase subunit SecG [Novosphingobium tardum]|uniref:Protein-export membrane protein SecG n=1 Tax=Novosphingobium tardum TaxID=1538021 RepID=A0ABV8RQC7_9SPHN